MDPHARTLRTSTLLLVVALIVTVLVAYTLVDRANQRANIAEGSNAFTEAVCDP